MGAPNYLLNDTGERVRSNSWFELTGTSHTAYRFFRWSGVSGDDPQVTSPSAGSSVDGVCGDTVTNAVGASRGHLAKVEAGESISSGDDLETNGSGQAITAGTGTVVARALEGASSGQNLWIAFTGN